MKFLYEPKIQKLFDDLDVLEDNARKNKVDNCTLKAINKFRIELSQVVIPTILIKKSNVDFHDPNGIYYVDGVDK